MPEKNINEIPRHSHDIILHELHMEQDLIDIHFVKFTLGHDQKRHREAKKEKFDEGQREAEEKRSVGSHSNANRKIPRKQMWKYS